MALAAEEGRFDQLRVELFADQPPEQSGGFQVNDLIALGQLAGITSASYVSGVHEGRYEEWVLMVEVAFQEEDPNGTPAALFDGKEVDTESLYDPETLRALLRR